jgi:c-di-GMP-binding flagellar brake protein YcgR
MDRGSYFGILRSIMSAEGPAPPPTGREWRDYYRITVTLPIRLQPETDMTEGTITEKSVNLSAGGIGLVVNIPYQANEVLACTLLLPDQAPFTASIEVLRVDPLPSPPNTYRLHARFIRLTSVEREMLVRCVLQLQRAHLNKHYSA